MDVPTGSDRAVFAQPVPPPVMAVVAATVVVATLPRVEAAENSLRWCAGLRRLSGESAMTL
eukprot:2917749-Prymnesium_polylepis.1